MMKNVWKKAGLFLALVLSLQCVGCGKEKDGNTKVIFTAGPGKDEVFRIGDEVCNVPEIMLYLTTTQNQYENVYGEEIWKTKADGVSLEENVKDTVLAKNAQIKSMYLLAKSREITLNDEEEKKVRQAGEEFINGLNPTEKELLKIDKDLVTQMYRQYAMANKVYEDIIKDINPEISDDEARIITVSHILIKTYHKGENDEKVPYDADQKKEAFEKATQIRAMAVDGEHDFSELCSHYSEDGVETYYFGKGEMDPAIEEAAFKLETNEVSDVIVTDSGYHIIKCLNTFNREQTDENKLKIVEKRRNEAFGAEYDAFVAELAKRLNESVWEQVTLIRDPQVTTQNFFDVYDHYFGKE